MKIENYYSGEELKLIKKNEKPIVTLKQDSPNAIDSMTSFNLVITEKRIYTYQYNQDTEIKNVINIEKVEFVNFEKKTTQKNFGVPLFLAIMLIIPAALFFTPLFEFEAAAVFGILFIVFAVILLVISIAIAKKKVTSHLIIGTSGAPIEIEVQDLKAEQIEDIQTQIFKILDKQKNAN